MRRLPVFFNVLTACTGLAFPVVVYFSLKADVLWPPSIVLLSLVALRVLTSGLGRTALSAAAFAGAMLLICATVWFEDARLFKVYPVAMSLAVCATFTLSLWQPKSLLEAFSERFVDLDSEVDARPYLRRLTGFWAFVLFANAVLAAWSAVCASEEFWVAYTTLYSYAIMLSLGAIEWLYRQYYKRRRALQSSTT